MADLNRMAARVVREATGPDRKPKTNGRKNTKPAAKKLSAKQRSQRSPSPQDS